MVLKIPTGDDAGYGAVYLNWRGIDFRPLLGTVQ